MDVVGIDDTQVPGNGPAFLYPVALAQKPEVVLPRVLDDRLKTDSAVARVPDLNSVFLPAGGSR